MQNTTQNKSLTTGQISGLLGIPVITLQRYIRDYREYFSATATRPDRGRRWDQSDVNNLIVIRRLSQKRASKDAIKKVLSGAEKDALIPIQNIFSMLEIADLTITQVQAAAQRSEKIATRLNYYYEETNRSKSLSIKIRDAVNALGEDVYKMKFAMMQPKTLPVKPRKFMESVREKFNRFIADEWERDIQAREAAQEAEDQER